MVGVDNHVLDMHIKTVKSVFTNFVFLVLEINLKIQNLYHQ
jgi:hypothetical protein